MTEMFGEAWSPMSVPDLAPDDDDDSLRRGELYFTNLCYNEKLFAFDCLYIYVNALDLLAMHYYNLSDCIKKIIY